MAIKEKAAAKPVGTSRFGGKGVGLVALLLTVAAGGAGFLSGHSRIGAPAAEAVAPLPIISEARIAKSELGQLLSLPPVVTNLGGRQDRWIRLEAAVLIADPKPLAPELAPKLADDVAALMRTVPPEQISGPSGFGHLKQELLERMKTRTNGTAAEIMIQSLIIE